MIYNIGQAPKLKTSNMSNSDLTEMKKITAHSKLIEKYDWTDEKTTRYYLIRNQWENLSYCAMRICLFKDQIEAESG